MSKGWRATDSTGNIHHSKQRNTHWGPALLVSWALQRKSNQQQRKPRPGTKLRWRKWSPSQDIRIHGGSGSRHTLEFKKTVKIMKKERNQRTHKQRLHSREARTQRENIEYALIKVLLLVGAQRNIETKTQHWRPRTETREMPDTCAPTVKTHEYTQGPGRIVQWSPKTRSKAKRKSESNKTR